MGSRSGEFLGHLSNLTWCGGVFLAKAEMVFSLLPATRTNNECLTVGYISVLDDHLLNFMNIHGCTTFQQDSASCHETKSVMNWFQTKNVRVLKWSRNSPDLNSIENLWTMNKKKVSTPYPTTLDELIRTIKEIWYKSINKNVCKNLTNSMPSRIPKVL